MQNHICTINVHNFAYSRYNGSKLFIINASKWVNTDHDMIVVQQIRNRVMLKQQVEALLSDIGKILPSDMQQAKSELESNLRAALTASLAKLELVTREEFDVQTIMLQRTRTQLDALHKRVQELEEKLK